MKFPGISLSNYMKGSSFDTENQKALANAVGMADQLSLQTFGNAARTKMNNESRLRMQEASNEAGVAISGIMGPANAISGLAGAADSVLGAFARGGMGGGSGGFKNFDYGIGSDVSGFSVGDASAFSDGYGLSDALNIGAGGSTYWEYG